MRSWTRQHLASLRLCSTARQSVRVRPLELLRWFKEQGCTCHDGVEIFEVPGAGWGLRLGPSAVSCAVGARLTTTPKRLVFAADDSKPPLLSGERLPEASRQLRADLVASFLPTLLGRQHSAVGPWASAVEAPRSLPLLLVKENGDASDEVRRSSLYHGAVALRRALREEFSAVKSSLQDRCPDARLTDSHLWAAMLWAQALLMSRAAVLPRDGHRLVLAPLADFANHAASFGSANAELLAEKDGSVSLVARKPIVAGEEITHCYAEMDNEQLLFCYGSRENSKEVGTNGGKELVVH